MATQSCILVTVLLFWSSAISSSLPRESRQTPGDAVTGDTVTVHVQFMLFSTYTSECLTGLTEDGTQIRVEFRLLTGQNFNPGEWISAGNVTLDEGDRSQTLTIGEIDPGADVNEFIQFRVLQSEHGGGSCNCWGLSNFTVNTIMDSGNKSKTIDITEECDEQSSSVIGMISMDEVRLFCGGSASVPRGIVTAADLLGLGNTTIQCNQVNGSNSLIDPGVAAPTEDCTAAYPRLDIDFNLDLLERDSCIGPSSFDEGVELAIRIGRDWIPLQYISPNLPDNRNRNSNFLIGHLNDQVVTIRGYTLNDTITDGEVNQLLVSVCGSFLTSEAQLRWMQTAASISRLPTTNPNNWRDLWTLDNVTVVLHVNETYNKTLIKDNFDNQTELNPEYWMEDIRNGMISDFCGADYVGDNSLLMGSVCNTTGCGGGQGTISSRIIRTASLDIGVQLGIPRPITDEPNTETNPPSTPSPPTMPPTPPPSTPPPSTPSPSTPPPSTPSPSTPSPPTMPPTPDDADDLIPQQQLGDALEEVLALIRNDEELANITTMPPATAAIALERVVGARVVDETVVAYLLADMVDRSRLPAGGVEDMVSFNETILSIGDMLLNETSNNEEPSIIAGSTLIATIEKLAFNGFTTSTDSQHSGNIEVIHLETRVDNEDTYFTSIDVRGSSIQVPTELVRIVDNGTGPITVGSVYYRNMSGLLPGTLPGERDTVLASPVVSTSLLCGDNICDTANIQLSLPVIVTLKHSKYAQALIENDDTSEATCVFWEFITNSSSDPLVNGRWDTEGCVRNDGLSNFTQTVCECTHLTNFAILLSARSVPPTPDVSTTDDADDLIALQQLGDTLEEVLGLIRNDEELGNILTMPPATAAIALEGVVGARVVDETVVAYLLADIVDRSNLSDGRVEDMVSFSETILSIGDMLLEKTSNNEEPSIIAGSTLIATIEKLAFNGFTTSTDPQHSGNIVIHLETPVDNEDIYFTSIGVRSNSIQVPTELVRIVSNGTGPVTVASVYYRNMSGLLPGTLPGERDTVLASPVVSTSLQCGDNICDTANIQLSQPVIVTLKHSKYAQAVIENDDTNEEATCVFWEFITTSDNLLANGRWDTEGCVRNDSLSNSTQTVCECTHLTNFAILLSAQPLNIPSGVALSLSIIGYIGVSLSVIAMLATIVALVFFRTLWNMRNYIHINLCVSLILAQLTFVIGVTPHGGGGVVDPGCRTAAVLMHYLFLVSFMWMLMEGVVLYLVLVKVFVKEHERKYIVSFTIVSYGAPLLYMVLCIPLGFAVPQLEDSYSYQLVSNNTTTIVCWLNPITNFILTFIVPVVVILLVNFGFFIMAIVTMCRHQKRQGKKQEVSSWLKSSVSLVTVMGLTWIIGILVFEVPALLPLAYIFTIFVSFQGVAIFILFVPLSEPVRDAYSKWWKKKLAKHRYQYKFESTSTKSTTLSNVSTNVTSPSLDSSLKLESSVFNSTVERESGLSSHSEELSEECKER
ncbi:uncharacterized protein LOC135346210 isoform X4 [Halichondria panicea]|uniref:uncharacterized protein LOC135346210 isoform X4 n=1 Tax=Halichondria panicea TaxID=6063 RepID=UPI00312B6260